MYWKATAICCASLLSACHVSPKDIGRAPHMTPVGAGLTNKLTTQSLRSPVLQKKTTTASLWREYGSDLFRDPRARRIGDTLTVKISIKDKASFDSQSNRSKTASSDLKASVDFTGNAKFFKETGSASGGVNADSTSTHDGRGATSRAETIELLLAAVVTNRLPNGNMVISGTQEVRVNFEVRVLTVAGIVRPKDIGQDNSISYDKIAEARISYGGRGRISEVQQPNWGQQVFDWISPF